MMKILVILVFFTGFLTATVINSIVVAVEKEPITSYELEQTMKILKLSKQEALTVLVNEKLEKSQIKQLGIVVNELDVDEAIAKIAQQSRLNLEQFKASLKDQSYEQFRLKFKKDLEKRKLYEKIANLAKIDFSDEGVKKFFEKHREKWTLYTRIGVRIYRSNHQNSLELMRTLKKAQGPFEEVLLTPNNADHRLLEILSALAIGDFSPVLNAKRGYEIYEVRAKTGAQSPDFEQVKESILNAYIVDQKQNFVKDYFNKLRSKASIEYFS